MKTESQKIARGFEIIGYILLAPALISLIFPVIFVIAGIASLKIEGIVFGLIPILVATPGMVLLVGYFRHSRGLLNEDNIGTLWFWTIIYNALLALPLVAYLGYEITQEREMTMHIYPIITLYVAAITMAFIGFRNRESAKLG